VPVGEGPLDLQGAPASCGPTQADIDVRAAKRSSRSPVRFARTFRIGPGWPARCGRSHGDTRRSGHRDPPFASRGPSASVRVGPQDAGAPMETRGEAVIAIPRSLRADLPHRSGLARRMRALPWRHAAKRSSRSPVRFARTFRVGPGWPAGCGRSHGNTRRSGRRFLPRSLRADLPHRSGLARKMRALPWRHAAKRSSLPPALASRGPSASVRVGPQDAGAPMETRGEAVVAIPRSLRATPPHRSGLARRMRALPWRHAAKRSSQSPVRFARTFRVGPGWPAGCGRSQAAGLYAAGSDAGDPGAAERTRPPAAVDDQRAKFMISLMRLRMILSSAYSG
jgi:hypothetical protein